MRKRSSKEAIPRVRTWLQKIWAHIWVRRVVFGVLLLLCFVVGLQFTYPDDRALPQARIGDVSAGWKTVDELEPLLNEQFMNTSLMLQAGEQKVTTKLGELGAVLEVKQTATQLAHYPWWQRIVPFSLFVVQPELLHVSLSYTDSRLDSAAKELATRLKSEPQNGSVTLSETGEVSVAAARQGVTVTTESVEKAIKNTQVRFGTTTVLVEADVINPSVTNDMIEATKARLVTVLKTSLTIVNSLEKDAWYQPDAKTVASWIHIGDTLELTINRETLFDYANSVAKNSLVTPGTSTIVMVDGVEKNRTSGQPGRGVDIDTLVNDVTKALLESGDTDITMKFRTLQPTVVYQRNYTSSQTALQAYLNDVTKGAEIQISVRQLSGPGWSASAGAEKSVVAASTYKLFISQLLFDRINGGQIGWSDAIQGTTVETCLRNTIVLSANNCAEQWIGEWGRSTINSNLYAKGYSSATSFMMPDATHTSAADLQKLLMGLHSRTMFNGSDTSRLIDLMKQQVYRRGIPAGSTGVVADKVGFLWDYLNDAAIVYHPRGTYVLVVMTKGQSWGKIAEITQQIERILYP